LEIPETNTSKTCHRCNEMGIRKNGLFKCNNCKLEDNADRNGAINIGKRALGYISRVGVAVTLPRTEHETIVKSSEAQVFKPECVT